MGWHWSWQDPVAFMLAALGVAMTLWLRRRAGKKGGCAKCALRGLQRAPPSRLHQRAGQ